MYGLDQLCLYCGTLSTFELRKLTVNAYERRYNCNMSCICSNLIAAKTNNVFHDITVNNVLGNTKLLRGRKPRLPRRRVSHEIVEVQACPQQGQGVSPAGSRGQSIHIHVNVCKKS